MNCITTGDASKIANLAITRRFDRHSADLLYGDMQFETTLAKQAGRLLTLPLSRWPKQRRPAVRLAEAYLHLAAQLRLPARAKRAQERRLMRRTLRRLIARL